MEPVARERIRREAIRARTGRADLDGVLDAGLVGTFSTVVDGRPLSVPMLYGRVDDRLYLHGSTGADALRRVAAGAPANLCVTLIDGIVVADNLFNSSANYRSAVVRGYPAPVSARRGVRGLTAMSERLIPGRSAEGPPAHRQGTHRQVSHPEPGEFGRDYPAKFTRLASGTTGAATASGRNICWYPRCANARNTWQATSQGRSVTSHQPYRSVGFPLST